MAKKKPSHWDEIDGGAGFIIPVTLLRHQNFHRLGPHACKLVFDLGRQYSGHNNGFLCCSWTLMKDQGWNSPHTLQDAMLELEHFKIIVRTQQGGLNKPNLHGFTWRIINHKKDKTLDMAPTMTPMDSWKHDAIPEFDADSYKKKHKGKRRRARLKAVA